MYHSGVNEKDTISIGRSPACELQLEHDSVSRLHATVQATDEGYLAVQDNHSSNGTFLRRNGRWVRVKRVILGTQDRVRFGEDEVPLDRLVEQFGHRSNVRLREGYSARGKPLVFEDYPGDLPKPRVVLENPRRNPLTGDIEENRQD
jgi:pSer/pThr/pTyr-binding forkhead associated (FHA) protein